MKKIILSTVVIAALSTVANADFLGAEVGYAVWSPSLTGTIKGNSAIDRNIDLENDLGYGDRENNSFFWASFDHPLPILPNIKVQKTNYTTSNLSNKTVTFDGKTYTGNVASSLTLDQIDAILYYRLLDNWVNLDLGLNIKTIDGNIKLSSSTSTPTPTDKDFNAIIPMLYAKAKFDMPFTGLSVEADCSYIGYNGSKFTDMKAALIYESPIGLGINAGYRSENLVLDDIDDTNTDIKINGFYAGVFYHF